MGADGAAFRGHPQRACVGVRTLVKPEAHTRVICAKKFRGVS